VVSHRGRIIAAFACAASLVATGALAQSGTEAKYPDWKGQWLRIGGGQYDPAKPGGRGQQPPLIPEYQAIWESRMKAESSGSQDYNPQARCLPGGMPRMMIVYESMELVVTPEITYVLMEYLNPLRRIYTDGRDWPETIEPTFAGYSIGHWQDSDGDGRYDTLEVETRGLKGPRIYEATGIPLHDDNETIIKERIWLDKANPDVLVDEITTIDHALTRPWVITRKYKRDRHPSWLEFNCSENNPQITIGNQSYYLGPDGDLMPTRKDQPPPDLKYFNRPRP
jgi:hypothetical protein